MKKILIVSIAFPPKCDPESLQVGRYVKYLSKQTDIELEAITSSNPTLFMETDSQLESLQDGVKSVVEVSLFENRYINYLIRKTSPSLLEYPDSKYSFRLANPAVSKPDMIYSRSYPVSSTLLALKLKKKWRNVPWVLHLSDPWAASFEGDSPATNFTPNARKWNKKKEAECFEKADQISFTSQKTIELYEKEYPVLADKFILTPNVYDEEILNTEPINFSARLNIVYTGGFGEKRDPSFFLAAVANFLKDNPKDRQYINFVFTGPMTFKNKKKFNQFNGISEVSHLGVVSYSEMIEIQNNSHVLVNIDSDIKDPLHSVFFPSKLLEYMAAQRRVLAITNSHSVTHEVINNEFGDCIEFGDEQGLSILFQRYLENFKEKNESFFVIRKKIEKYGAKQNASLLVDRFKELIKNSTRGL